LDPCPLSNAHALKKSFLEIKAAKYFAVILESTPDEGQPETVLRHRQASIFAPPLHVTLKLALEVVVM